MNNNFLLENKTAMTLYNKVKELPIIDYHCHLAPKEIYEDKPFENIGEIFLKYDHYKWRLMRAAGIDEEYITGDKPFYDKFLRFSEAIEFAAGNPLYHWTKMELKKYFSIDIPLKRDTADDIWNKANKVIKGKSLSPRKLINYSNVEYIATTDDIIDSLSWHKKLADDKSFSTKIVPSFRTDNLLLIRRKNYSEYIKELSEVSKININDLSSLKESIKQRLSYFKEAGCKFSDIGIAYFPNKFSSFEEADNTFKKIIERKSITDEEYFGFLGYMYLFLGDLYKKNNIVMQLHLAVTRNTNTILFENAGADCGVDCIGNVDVKQVGTLLDKLNSKGSLPLTIIYTLNPSINEQLMSVIGAFSNVRMGAAWWFCDHKRGIENTMKVISETGCIGTFLGMLTDSRSFLSYARHDYFRRIMCNLVAYYVDIEEYPLESALELVGKISYNNIKQLVGGVK